MSCSIATQTKCEVQAKYSSFDLFRLMGSDAIIANSTPTLVCFQDSIPSSITFSLSDREVKLTLDSIFQDLNSTVVFKYITSNLYGGFAGRNRESTRNSTEYLYEVYIDKSEQIIIKSYDLDNPEPRPFCIRNCQKISKDSILTSSQFVSTSSPYHKKLESFEKIEEYKIEVAEYLNKLNNANDIQPNFVTSIFEL